MVKKQCFGTSHVPLSPAVRCGNMVFISGQVPVDASGQIVGTTVAQQTRQVMDNIKQWLAQAGATLDDVVKTTVYLQDARDFGAFNAVYATYFPANPPARTTCEARLMIDIKVEIDAIACVGPAG